MVSAPAAEPAKAAAVGDIIVLAAPLVAYNALPAAALAGKTALSTGNYDPSRNGRIADLESGAVNTAQYEERFPPGATSPRRSTTPSPTTSHRWRDQQTHLTAPVSLSPQTRQTPTLRFPHWWSPSASIR